MPEVTYHHADGTSDVVNAPAGTSVMRAAVAHGVTGIIGECGGQAMCATCHVYVRPAFLERLPPISDDEDEMLDAAAAPRDEQRSRLGCQLRLEDDLDGLHVDVPTRQT